MQVWGCLLRQELCLCVSFTPVPPLWGILYFRAFRETQYGFCCLQFFYFFYYYYSLLFFADSPGAHNNVAINRDICSSRIFPLQVNLCKYGNLPQDIFQTWWRNGREGITWCFRWSLQTSLTWLWMLLLLFLSLFSLTFSLKYTSRKVSE